jgi:hypothetical protein
VTVVIGSAIVPTLIAQKFFRPEIESVIVLGLSPASTQGPVQSADGEPVGVSRAASIREE